MRRPLLLQVIGILDVIAFIPCISFVVLATLELPHIEKAVVPTISAVEIAISNLVFLYLRYRRIKNAPYTSLVIPCLDKVHRFSISPYLTYVEGEINGVTMRVHLDDGDTYIMNNPLLDGLLQALRRKTTGVSQFTLCAFLSRMKDEIAQNVEKLIEKEVDAYLLDYCDDHTTWGSFYVPSQLITVLSGMLMWKIEDAAGTMLARAKVSTRWLEGAASRIAEKICTWLLDKLRKELSGG